MKKSLPPVEHWIFRCKFEHFNFCLNNGTEFVASPVFYLERMETFWCLQLKAIILCNDMCNIQLQLSRPSINVGPPKMNVQFALYLETVHGQRIAEEEINSFLFSPGSHYNTAVNIPAPVTSILKTDDALLVACEMYLVMEKCRNSVEPCIEQVSKDFEALFNERDKPGNAVLIVGEQNMNINVHKEILCARSSKLKECFRAEVSEFQIPNYSPEVVKSMLAFMYSSDFTPLMNKQNFFELWRCANEYEVSHLLNILQPNEMFGIVKFQLDSAEYEWNCINFTPEQHMLPFNDTGFKMLELKLSKRNIVFRVTANFNVYNTKLYNLFHIEMWNLNKINCFTMEMSVFGNDNVSITRTEPMKPDVNGIYKFSILVADEFLFPNKENHNEAPILHASFKFKFKLRFDNGVKYIVP